MHKGGHIDAKSLRRGTVAVVGNSDLMLANPMGREIDSHDFVIRFNRAWPNMANQRMFTGRKTTHMSLVIRRGYGPMIKRNPRIQFFLPMPPPVKFVPDECKKLPCIASVVVAETQLAMKTRRRPSSGMTVLTWLLRESDCLKISIFGMDGMQSGKWYEDKPHWVGHDKKAEANYLKEIQNDKRVVFYQP